MNIRTARLTIRTLTGEDWPAMQRIAEDFRRSPYAVYDMPLPTDEPAIRELTARFAESGLFFAVEAGELIGYVCFHEDQGSYDLGYCFHSDYQGKGYAFESCRATMAELSRLHPAARFTAGTALENLPSCRLLERLGFRLAGTKTLSFHKDARGNDISFTGGQFRRE